MKKKEAINNVANRQWFVLLAGLGGPLGVALFEAFAAPQIQGEIDRLTTQLNAAVAKLKGCGEQIKTAQEKCNNTSNLISKEMERITDLKGGLTSTQFVFVFANGDLTLIVNAAQELKSVCEKFLKDEGVRLQGSSKIIQFSATIL